MKPETAAAIRRLGLFALGGVLGFVVDSLVLHAMLAVGAGFYSGRLVSFLCAVLATWLFNRNRTFRERRHGRGLLSEALRYLFAMSTGGALNLLCYAVTIEQWALTRAWPVLAVGVGCIAGMALNFAASNWWVFRRKPSDGIEGHRPD